jgi:DNA-binding response OmpR family regulator
MSVPTSATPAQGALPDARARVLVAVDQPARRERLAAVLRGLGYGVATTSRSGVAARAPESGVIVMEWSDDAAIPPGGPPVIALLPRDGEALLMGAVAAGASDWLLGPASSDELAARVELALRRGGEPVPTERPAGATELALRCAPDGTIVSARGPAMAITGMSADRLIALPWQGLSHPEDAERVGRRLDDAFGDAHTVHVETHRVRGPGGRHLWVETRCCARDGVADLTVRDVSGARRERDGEVALRRLATMVARGEPAAAVAEAIATTTLRMLDAEGAAVLGAEAGPPAVAGVIASGPDAEALRAHGHLVVEATRDGRACGAVAVAGGDEDWAGASTWLDEAASLLELVAARESRADPAVAETAALELLESETLRARRYGRALGLALIEVVDAGSGSMVPAPVVERLDAMARAGERVVAAGGRRIVWLMPETSAVGAWCAVERIRCSLAADGASPRLAVGVAELEAEESSGSLLARTSRALDVATLGNGEIGVIHTPGLDAMTHSVLGPGAAAQAEVLSRMLPLAADASEVSDLAHAIALARGWSPRDAQRLGEAALVVDLGLAALPHEVRSGAGAAGATGEALLHVHPILSAHLASGLDEEQRGWVRAHHERYGGEGYPDALEGEQIPEGGRILAVADAWLGAEGGASAEGGDRLARLRESVGTDLCPRAVEALAAVLESPLREVAG